MNKTYIKIVYFTLFTIIGLGKVNAQSAVNLAIWNFNGRIADYGASPEAPNISTNSNVTIGGLTRGSGLGTGGTPEDGAWGANGMNQASENAAITNNDFITLTVKPNTGYKLALTEIAPHNFRVVGSSGETTFAQWQYTINGGTYTDIGTDITLTRPPTANNGVNQAAINLSAINALQNLNSSQTVTFRLVIWQGTGGNRFFINSHNNAGAANRDFIIKGSLCKEPSVPTLTQGILNLKCANIVDSLMSTGNLIAHDYIVPSSTLNLAIPDNSATGVTNTIAVNGISSSAVIDSVVVLFNLNHDWLDDVEILLRAPNNRIIALAANQGPSGVGSYTNCRITSNNSATALSTTSSPITGTYRANATTSGNLIGSFGANLTSTFSDLFTTINGNWRIEAYDDAALDLGTLLNWTLKISYRDTQTIWSPLTGLFTDLAATIPYSGTNLKKVYARPSTTTKYYTTATNGACTQIDSIIDSAKPATDLVTLAASTVTGAVAQCTDGGWTYYSAAANPAQLIFAINKNGNTFTNTVDITVSSGAVDSSKSSNGGNQEHGSFMMKRYWNVDCGGCTPTTNGGVSVRFFYDPSDTAVARTAMRNSFTALKASNPSTLADTTLAMQWVKTVGVPYTTSVFTGNRLTAPHIKQTPIYGALGSLSYVQFDTIKSFSGGGGGFGFGPSGGGGGGIGLPVTWAGFDVLTAEQGNVLIWKTASEQNTDYFEVQYSYDAQKWFIGSDPIPAAGNSADMRTYHYTHADFAPFVYYRIKQVDLDGKFENSVVKTAKRAAGPSFVVKVYPIPMLEDNLVHVSAKGIDKSEMHITMTDISGKVIRTVSYIPSSESILESFDMSPLTPGLYFIEVQNGQGKEMFKVSR